MRGTQKTTADERRALRSRPLAWGQSAALRVRAQYFVLSCQQLGDIGEAVSLVSTAQTGSLHRLSGEEGYALAHRDASSKPSNYTTRTNEIVPVSVTTGTSDNSTFLLAFFAPAFYPMRSV